ncbi:hypothetical protein K2173_004879 [Erythroxylum novogranatense]|uniref:Uncharacterized protein n=1 Tax=Erythroxylum novogranatense TaxID=1862640 RepID=A0AAV8TAY1_9ROSI|nr:hypothetical protein K2173_004879 [Erythroxylum novogranatense]
MTVSLNSVVGFNSTKLQGVYQHTSRCPSEASAPKLAVFTSLGISGSRILVKGRRKGLYVSVAESSNLGDKESGDAVNAISGNQLLTGNPTSMDTDVGSNGSQTNSNSGTGPQSFGTSNGSAISSELNQERKSNSPSTPKRAPMTARERLRAARVRSRYAGSKPSKPEMGSKVLAALKASDKGKKRSGLPEAPTNLFDDSKRGLPKEGWTFQFPGGSDLFIIAFSFVFISTVMFATTYIVWKAGAIHFNEY